MKVRIVYRADGGVSIIRPTGKPDRTFEESCEKAVQGQDDLYGRPCDDIDDSELPQNRKYRAAWVGSVENGISIDTIKKAKVDSSELPKGGKQSEEGVERAERINTEMRKIAEDSLVAKGELEREVNDGDR